MAQYLLSVNASLTTKDKTGDTPLHHCVLADQPLVTGLLIDCRADLKAQNKSARTVLELAREKERWQVVTVLELRGWRPQLLPCFRNSSMLVTVVLQYVGFEEPKQEEAGSDDSAT